MTDTKTTEASKTVVTPQNSTIYLPDQPAFDPDAMFKAAEAELSATNARVEANLKRITELKAQINADRAKLKDLERILAARTPRTRKAVKK